MAARGAPCGCHRRGPGFRPRWECCCADRAGARGRPHGEVLRPSRFATITDAVAAAPAGSTVQVCPGEFHETVVVDKQLTLLGAQHGVDARTGRPNIRTESVVDAPTGGFVVAPGVTGVTIDGFTIRISGGPASGAEGIVAAGGLTAVDNVIALAEDGIALESDGARRAPSRGTASWPRCAGSG